MLYITKTVGSQSAIYDSDDGTLEWIDNAELRQVIKGGIQVHNSLSDGLQLHAFQCNFNKDRSNLFETCTISHICGKKYVIKDKFGKRYKACYNNNMLCMNNGIRVAMQEVLRYVKV